MLFDGIWETRSNHICPKIVFFAKYTCTFKYIVFVIKFSGFIYFLVHVLLSNLCIT